MTVSRLIEELNKHPQDMRVIVSGYEGGYCDIDELEELPLKLNVNKASYEGPHDWAIREPYDEIALNIGR